ncbi:MAG: hypothetical protein AAFR68_09860 [Pseudomonadota bacterium]
MTYTNFAALQLPQTRHSAQCAASWLANASVVGQICIPPKSEAFCEMSSNTVIGQKLELAVQQELTRMDNEWFFKWHFIGKDEPVDIESFKGKPIHYSGIAYSGSAVDVYWDTISRYRKIKVSDFFDTVEAELPKYPKHVREQAIKEAEGLVKMFASSIQRRAVEKDRILRGDGINFPKPHDGGRWEGSSRLVIETRAKGLLESYCDLDIKNEGKYVVERMMNETLSFVKADGTEHKDGIKGLVTEGKVITFDSSLPVQPNDRFLREVPSGLVEEYIVEDPGYQGGIRGAIKPHFQASVRRSDSPAAPARTIINNIQGDNARVNFDSVDNSQNLAISAPDDEIFQQLREKLTGAGLEAEENARIMGAIDEMEKAKGTPAFREKYQGFMAAAANHASVFGALLAALAMLI